MIAAPAQSASLLSATYPPRLSLVGCELRKSPDVMPRCRPQLATNATGRVGSLDGQWLASTLGDHIAWNCKFALTRPPHDVARLGRRGHCLSRPGHRSRRELGHFDNPRGVDRDGCDR